MSFMYRRSFHRRFSLLDRNFLQMHLCSLLEQEGSLAELLCLHSKGINKNISNDT